MMIFALVSLSDRTVHQGMEAEELTLNRLLRQKVIRHPLNTLSQLALLYLRNHRLQILQH